MVPWTVHVKAYKQIYLHEYRPMEHVSHEYKRNKSSQWFHLHVSTDYAWYKTTKIVDF